MESGFSLQVQAVIYNNEVKALKKNVLAMANAVRVEKEEGGSFSHVKFVYGDASEQPVLSGDILEEIAAAAAPFMDFEYKAFGVNTGYGQGNNLLAQGTKADYLLIMNPDIIASPRLLIDLLRPFSGAHVGIVEARQTPIEHPKEYNIETGETAWASGACFMIPSTLFLQEKGFDANTFFMYCEDVDLSWRVRLAGYKIIYQPLSPVYHAKRLQSSEQSNPSETEVYYSALSGLFMNYKWSNDSLLQQYLHEFSRSELTAHKEAAACFMKRKQEKKLPGRLDPRHEVASFVGGYYAENRFVL